MVRIVQPDGTLTEQDSGLELSYLFWEAATNPTIFTPPSSPSLGLPLVEHFDPAYPSLSPSSPTAVLLPSDNTLLRYLDATLKKLTLHTSARNDFITFWLPKLQHHPFVALRFLPQAAYERAAELSVRSDPSPDVVTRVFMLFRGVDADEAQFTMWRAARERVGRVEWEAVVGVKPEASNARLFRALEWGAMEVLA